MTRQNIIDTNTAYMTNNVKLLAIINCVCFNNAYLRMFDVKKYFHGAAAKSKLIISLHSQPLRPKSNGDK